MPPNDLNEEIRALFKQLKRELGTLSPNQQKAITDILSKLSALFRQEATALVTAANNVVIETDWTMS
ncbi:MAG: hypothetical protein ACJ79H_13035 [Myxococcales bacterium]